jgi:hypothetical protein
LIEYRRMTLLRISLSNSIGFSASTAVPLWVGSVGAHFAFPSWGAGALATGQLACAALLNAVTPWLFRVARLRRLAFMATAAALFGNVLAWLGSSSVFIAGCLLCGAGFGVLLNVTNRLVAGSSALQRGYAIIQLVEVLFCIGFYLGVPPIVERFGTLSVFAVLAVLCVGVFLLLAGVPVGTAGGLETTVPDDVSATPARVISKHGPPNTGAAVLSLCAAALLFAGQSSVNASLVPIGAAVGLSVVWVGRVISLGLLAGAGALGCDMLLVTLGGGGAIFIAGAIVMFMGAGPRHRGSSESRN